jgi:hypothetical protein
MRAMNCNKIWAVLALSILSGHVYSQKINRYVLEVEVTRPVSYQATKDIHGNFTFEAQDNPKTIEYWEVLSPTPLTLYQCQDSIRLGRARRVKNPYSRNQQNLTIDGTIDNIWDQDIHQGDTYDEDPDLWEYLTD